MQKALEERNPAIHGFLENNQEFFTNIRDTLRDLRKGQARLDRVFNLDDDDRQLLDLAKNAPDKLVQQLKTGKLGMSEKEEAKLMGMEVIESDHILPTDLVGPNREVFITGTACGLMPVCHIEGLETAQPGFRPIMDKLRNEIAVRSEHDIISFPVDGSDDKLQEYLKQV